MRLVTLSVLLFFIFASFVVAVDDEYKPYLHKPIVPQHPELNLYGEYSTYLYTGGATYSYPLNVPSGVNGLKPMISISYNSQSVNGRPSVLGSGWMMNKDFIYQDTNGTQNDETDDRLFMNLDGSSYELIYVNGEYKTKINYHYRIQYVDNYWIVTKKDGTQYRFGYTSQSRNIASWYLDQITDTLNNVIYYNYEKNIFSTEINTIYLTSIVYNADESKRIQFNYQEDRPDKRLIYEQGQPQFSLGRLNSINIFVNNELVRRYSFQYEDYTSFNSLLSSIVEYGSLNQTPLYSISFDYYNSTAGFNQTTSYESPELFSNTNHTDYGTRLADVNKDGYVDIIRKKSSVNKVYLNNGTDFVYDDSWSLPLAFIDPTNNYDLGVRLADINLDGYIDILKGRTSNLDVYIHNSTGWNIDETYTLPEAFVDASGVDLGVRLVDVNGDGYMDFIKSTSSTDNVYFFDGQNWTTQTTISVPEAFVDASGVDLGVRLVDVNGDGYVDILKGDGTDLKGYLGNGTGWIQNDTYAPPVSFITGDNKDRGVRLVDVNGDGLVDLLEDFFNSTSEKGAWLNSGYGWVSSDEFVSPVAFTSSGYSVGRRLADVNGDGYSDIIIAQEGDVTTTYLRNQTYPYLLKSITTAYGGSSSLDYEQSTHFNNSNGTHNLLGFNIWVVDNVTRESGYANGSTTYVYEGGSYDYLEQEFRGFKNVTSIGLLGKETHYFYQDDYTKGIEYQKEIYDLNNVLYSLTQTIYAATPDRGVYNLSLLYSSNFLYDGEENPVVTNTSYAYNRFGNYEQVIEYGDVNVYGDERYRNYTYALNTDVWIVDKVARERVYDFRQDLVSDVKTYYDERGLGSVEKGLVTKQEVWNNYGNNTQVSYDYDSYGNVVLETDARGNIMRYVYDQSHIYPASVVNTQGHISFFEYNISNGNLLWEEKNGIRTYNYYDEYGRLIEEVKPYDTRNSPTLKYVYSLDGTVPESISTSQRTTANKSLDVSYYYDGFGQLVQLKTQAESGQDIVKNIFYDGEGRVVAEQLPYYDDHIATISAVDTNILNTTYTYDALGRITLVENTDGSTKNVSFSQYNISDFDENGNKHVYTLDAYGRIVAVYEFNTNDVGIDEIYATTYSYDDNDNLILITDNEGHEFSFLYDSLSRKIAMSDPDLGTWSYSYDALGNLITQTDNKDQTITLTYDTLSRITSKHSDDVNITFTYDEQYYGTLSSIDFLGYTYTYNYDERYRVTDETLSLDGETFQTSFLYDSANRLLSERGPETIDYYYNKQGLVYKIPGYVTSVFYEPFGGIANKTYSNSLITTYSYYDTNNRLKRITVPSVQNLTYAYDSVGNILNITDTINSINHVMTYDSLHRLRTVSIGDDTYKYSFNSIGNLMKMVHNDSTKHYTYGESIAHAPDYIVEGTAGIDVYNPQELFTGSKNRTFEAYLVNDMGSSVTTNLTAIFDDGNSFTSNDFSVDTTVWVFIQNNYSRGGNYAVTLSSPDDSQSLDTTFGARAQSLEVLLSQTNNSIFEFVVYNDVLETIENVSWNCTDGISSLLVTNLSGYQSLYDYIARTYPRPGEYTFACTVQSLDGTETKSITFQVEGVSVDDYDVLIENISHRVSAFTLKNDVIPLNVSLYINDETSQELNFSSGESVFAFIEQNYSVDGLHELDIVVNNSDYETSYEDVFVLQGVSVDNYDRVATNGTNSLFMFRVTNNWFNGTVVTNFTEIGLSTESNLSNNESVLVFIEKSYDEGAQEPELVSYVDVYKERVNDVFTVRPLDIFSYLTLSEGSSSVSELVVSNSLNESQSFDLRFDTQDQVFSDSLNVDSSSLFVFVELNHTGEGILETNATINNSNYLDSVSGVIVK